MAHIMSILATFKTRDLQKRGLQKMTFYSNNLIELINTLCRQWQQQD